jgi:hypothetical protein
LVDPLDRTGFQNYENDQEKKVQSRRRKRVFRREVGW